MDSQDADVPVGKTVLDVVECRIDEHARIVPSARLDSDSLMDKRVRREIFVRDRDGYLSNCPSTAIAPCQTGGKTHCACSAERPATRPSSTSHTSRAGC